MKWTIHHWVTDELQRQSNLMFMSFFLTTSNFVTLVCASHCPRSPRPCFGGFHRNTGSASSSSLSSLLIGWLSVMSSSSSDEEELSVSVCSPWEEIVREWNTDISVLDWARVFRTKVHGLQQDIWIYILIYKYFIHGWCIKFSFLSQKTMLWHSFQFVFSKGQSSLYTKL